MNSHKKAAAPQRKRERRRNPVAPKRRGKQDLSRFIYDELEED